MTGNFWDGRQVLGEQSEIGLERLDRVVGEPLADHVTVEGGAGGGQ